MKEIFFVFKTFVISLALILFLQVRVGTSTLETHAHLFIQESWVTEQIQLVAEGGAKLVRTAAHSVGEKLQVIFKKNSKSEEKKRFGFNFNRSESYQQSKKAKEENQQ